MNIYFGIVENRNDPLALGRCQVRVVGLHTHDKNLLPTSDLPWAATMQPTISAAMNGIGHTPIGPVEGTSVVVTYLDDSMQQGLILGAVGGIATEPVPIDYDDSGPILSSEEVEQTSLRTVKGPTNGNKLTFYDPNSSRSDLTTVLKANMRVSGYGIPEGATIVSIDSGTQITISVEVRDLGENIIDFKQPPLNAAAVVESKTLVTATTVSNKADEVKKTPTNDSIPTIPPKKSTSNETKASEGIKALIAACDKVGLTTKEQKCAVLAIAGGESGWIPQLEKYSYSAGRLREVFPKTPAEMIEKYANATEKGITRQEFFSFFYGPSFRGKNFLGNKTDADGGLYFGRGFIQITGRSNYETYQNEAKKYGLTLDLLGNPDSLDYDINNSALVAALYIKKRTSSKVNPNSSPGWYEAAADAVGINNTSDIKAKKRKFYEYFYGEASTGGHVKGAGVEIPTPPDSPTILNNFQPGPSEKSITSGSFSIGFRDPNNKYPLKDYLNESDVNRLARGVIEGTIVGDKDAKRKIGIPKPFDGEWDQPYAPFGAEYPYNKVFESESGHIQEWDDTPGQERVNTYHRSGTFTEVDANGTQVNYIVGDNFILMENNGCIHVAGECNITVDGTTNIFARSDLNLQVAGNAKIEVGNNADIGVANDVSLAVGGDMETHVTGQYKLTAEAGMEFITGGSIGIQSDQATAIKSGEFYLDSAAVTAIKSVGNFAVQSNANVGIKAGKKLYTTAGSDLNIKATGAVKLDGSTFLQQSGAAGTAANVEGIASLVALSLSIPSSGSPLYSAPAFLQPPPRQFEQNHPIETPDDWNTPEGRAVLSEKGKKEGIVNPPAAEATEEYKSTGGNNGKNIKADCSIIYTTKDFTKDYRLSQNFTVGMLISNNKHILQSQMLKPNRNAQERLYTVQEIVCNLAHLAQNVLEPALDILPNSIGGYGKLWHITSGYRLKGVVKNESATSNHCMGHCVDISLGNGVSMFSRHYDLIKKLDGILTYDQLILEYDNPDKCWIHIGYKPESNRRQAFTMINNVYDSSKKGFILLSGSVPPVTKN